MGEWVFKHIWTLVLLSFSDAHAAEPAVCQMSPAEICSTSRHSDATGEAFEDSAQIFLPMLNKLIDSFVSEMPMNQTLFSTGAPSSRGAAKSCETLAAIRENVQGLWPFGCDRLSEDLSDKECGVQGLIRQFVFSRAFPEISQPFGGGDLESLDYLSNCRQLEALPQRLLNTCSAADYDPLASVCRLRGGTSARNPQPLDRAQQLFPGVRQANFAVLDSIPISDTDKELFRKRLLAVQYEDNDCFASYNLANTFFPGALSYQLAESPDVHRVQVCPGLGLVSSSEYALVWALANEFAHAIDPCAMGQASSLGSHTYPDTDVQSQLDESFPIPNLLQCFRDSRSVKAQKILVEESRSRELENHGYARTPFCQLDETVEAFSDWWASRVLAQYAQANWSDHSPINRVNGLLNAMAISCGQPGEPGWYPEGSLRVHRLLFADPGVREFLGCTTSVFSCGPGLPYDAPSGLSIPALDSMGETQ